MLACPARPYLEVDVPVGEAVGTALVQEVDVFDEQAEEGDDNLEGAGCRSALASGTGPGASGASLGHRGGRGFLGTAGWLLGVLATWCAPQGKRGRHWAQPASPAPVAG